MTTKPPLTRDPRPEVKLLLIALIEASAKARTPEDVLDASVNHLGMNLATIAKLKGRSRGELKAMARKAFEDCLEMALANYAQVVVPGDTGGVH